MIDPIDAIYCAIFQANILTSGHQRVDWYVFDILSCYFIEGSIIIMSHAIFLPYLEN